MIDLAEDSYINLLCITSFPESGKTTILNLAFSIWNVIKDNKLDLIFIASKDLINSKNYLKSIEEEIKKNSLLNKDFGELFQDNIYKKTYLKINNCYIKAISIKYQTELKLKNKNPELIICNSIEDIYSVEDEKYKDILNKWFSDLVYPLTLNDTKTIFISKYLGDNSFQSQLSYNIRR